MVVEQFSEQGATAVRRAGELARRSGAVSPAHLLAAVLEVSGPLGEVAAVPHAEPSPKPRHGSQPPSAEVVHYDTLARQALGSAATWAARRGARAGPEDLLVVLVDQHSPAVVAALARMGPEADRLRQAALRMLGLPDAYGPVALEPLPPAGSVDRDALGIEDLPEEVWAAMEDRQRRLPLHRVRRRSDWSAVVINEHRAAAKVADRQRLTLDEKHALVHHHGEAVMRRGAAAAPSLVVERSQPSASSGPIEQPSHRRPGRLIPPGWVVWFGNRRMGLKVAWFRWTAQRY